MPPPLLASTIARVSSSGSIDSCSSSSRIESAAAKRSGIDPAGPLTKGRVMLSLGAAHRVRNDIALPPLSKALGNSTAACLTSTVAASQGPTVSSDIQTVFAEICEKSAQKTIQNNIPAPATELAAPINRSGVECIYNRHTVTLDKSSAGAHDPRYLHGHKDVFKYANTNVTARFESHTNHHIAAQSPGIHATHSTGQASASSISRNYSHEWLLHALENRNEHLVQLVTRQAHRQDMQTVMDGREDVPLLTQLAKELASGEPVNIGDTYQLLSINDAIEHGSPTISSEAFGDRKKVLFKRVTLQLIEKSTGQLHQLHLTQIAPPFVAKLLRAEDLHDAWGVFKASVLDAKNAVVFSQGGSGRNAAVLVYDALARAIEAGAIKVEEDIPEALEALVTSGKLARGPGFVHSAAQYQEIHEAAIRLLQSKAAGQLTSASSTSQTRTENAITGHPSIFPELRDGSKASATIKPQTPVRSVTTSEQPAHLYPSITINLTKTLAQQEIEPVQTLEPQRSSNSADMLQPPVLPKVAPPQSVGNSPDTEDEDSWEQDLLEMNGSAPLPEYRINWGNYKPQYYTSNK